MLKISIWYEGEKLSPRLLGREHGPVDKFSKRTIEAYVCNYVQAELDDTLTPG